MEAVGVGNPLGGLADSSVSARGASATVAQSVLLGVSDAAAMGCSLRKKQTEKCAEAIAGRMSWLFLRSSLVRGELLLDLPDDVLIRWNS